MTTVTVELAQNTDPAILPSRWVDVSSRLLGWNARQSRGNALEKQETASCSITLDNTDGVFDPSGQFGQEGQYIRIKLDASELGVFFASRIVATHAYKSSSVVIDGIDRSSYYRATMNAVATVVGYDMPLDTVNSLIAPGVHGYVVSVSDPAPLVAPSTFTTDMHYWDVVDEWCEALGAVVVPNVANTMNFRLYTRGGRTELAYATWLTTPATIGDGSASTEDDLEAYNVIVDSADSVWKATASASAGATGSTRTKTSSGTSVFNQTIERSFPGSTATLDDIASAIVNRYGDALPRIDGCRFTYDFQSANLRTLVRAPDYATRMLKVSYTPPYGSAVTGYYLIDGRTFEQTRYGEVICGLDLAPLGRDGAGIYDASIDAIGAYDTARYA